MEPGPRNLITDVEGLRVGNADDVTLKSGTTVLVGETPFRASVHVMGGAPGTRETDLLAPDKTVDAVDALVLSGGSAFGLDACSGVSDRLRAAGRGFAVGPAKVPIVPGAILFDLVNAGLKDWTENPYRAFGREAFDNATRNFQLGSVGAGCGALTANLKGGLGSASWQLDDRTTVGALVAVNALGSVVNSDSGRFWAAPFEMNAEFGGYGTHPSAGCPPGDITAKMEALSGGVGNTTIAIVATNASLSKTQCHRMAVAAHDGLARAIVPAHTPMDGDLIFAASTGTVRPEVEAKELAQIGAVAAHCLARAIARAIYEATADPGDLLATWQDKFGVDSTR